MKLLRALVRLLPVDSRDRRALDEVISDWRFEVSATSSLVQRIGIDVRGAWALLVAFFGVTWREIRVASAHGLLLSSALWLLCLTFASWLVLTITPPTVANDLAPGVWAEVKAGWVVTWAGFFVPIAFFAGCSVAYPRWERDAPFLGFAAWAAAVTFLADGWLIPLADAQSVVSYVNLSNFRGVVPVETPTLTELLTGSRGSFAIAHQLNDTAARAAGAAAFVLLAGTLAGTRVHVRLLLTASVFIGIEVVGYAMGTLSMGTFTIRAALIQMLLRDWMVPVVVLASAVAVASGRRLLQTS